jgi:uncharacterized protein YyaL (SSP411 family)
LEFYLGRTKEIVIVGPEDNALFVHILKRYLPDAVIAASSDPQADAASVPLFEGRAVESGPAAYVCENFVCQRPVHRVDELNELLA